VPDPIAIVTVDGLEVVRDGFSFTVAKAGGGKPEGLQGYLGVAAHLLVLRESDLAFSYLLSSDNMLGMYHFGTGITVPGRYRVFLQFGDDGSVVTVPFTVDVP